ncbi:hypothetical protein GQ457_12G014900 [Hibiscus cannabinus]
MVRCKNAAGSSQPSPPDAAEIAIFKNEAVEERYQQIQSKQLLQEKGFVFSAGERFGLPQDLYDVIVYHGWEKFAKHPDEKELQKKSINVTLVKEFCAHFTDPKQQTVYICSERVEFKAKAINKFFAIKRWVDLHTPFVNGMKDQNIDFLLKNLCFQGAEWDEANTTVERDRLKPAAKLWMHFLKINLMPTTHTATVNLTRLQLLHSILNSRSINLGQLIVDEAFAGISRKQSPLLFPILITALCRQQGVMEDENDFFIRGRQGIKPSQIPSLMGFDEDATASAPPGGARTIAAARMAELMDLTERTQDQLRDMQEKMTSLFHYMRERDEAIQSYFLELFPDELPLFPVFPSELFHAAQPAKRKAPQDQAAQQPPLKKKKVTSTSTATPPVRPPAPEERTRKDKGKDKGKAPVRASPRAPAPEATVEERYQQIQSKQLLQEKGFVFSAGERFGLPQDVYDVIVYHGWEKFAKHPDEKELQKKSINVTLVKEFCAHFTDPKQQTVYVCSERVEFKAKAINKFFAIKRWVDLHTPFVNGMKDQNIDFLLKNLCFQGAEWDEANTTVERDRLKPAAKLWMHFLKINLMPTTHTATVNLPRLQLLHSILNSRSINLGQLIVDEAFTGISWKQSPLLFPKLITALCRQQGVMEDENDFFIRGRQGIKPSQIPSLMGFDEHATASAPPSGARTIAAARMAELMALTERTQDQLRDMQEKMTSLFHYMRERDEAIQSYFLELFRDEDQAAQQPPLKKKKVTSTSTATPPVRPPAPEERTRKDKGKDKGKAPVRASPRVPAPEATVELDSDDDHDDDMPDAPPPPAPLIEPTLPRRRLKRKANRNISAADLATEENIISEAEDDGSSTTPEETPNPNPPSSKARYKRMATKQTPKMVDKLGLKTTKHPNPYKLQWLNDGGEAVTRIEKEEMLQHSRKDDEHEDTIALVH